MDAGNRMMAQSFGRARPPAPETVSRAPNNTPELPRAWVARAILASFDAIGRNFVTFVALIAAAAAPERIFTHLLHFDLRYLPLSYCIMLVMACGLWSAMIRFTLDSAKGAAVNFSECLLSGLTNLLSALVLVGRPFAGIAIAMLL